MEKNEICMNEDVTIQQIKMPNSIFAVLQADSYDFRFL